MNKWAVLLLVVFASCVMCRSITSVYVYTADTYARVEWSVDEDSSDDGVISYYELTIKDKTTDSAATTIEKNLGTEYPFDDYVYDALVAGHEYEVTITGKVVGGDDVEESITFETYDNLDCDHLDVIAAFFSMEIYGPVQYPSYTFCGRTWETYYTTPDLTSTARDMVAYNSDLQIAVVAFRGTIVTLEDWTVNFELGFSSCEDFIFNNDCKGDIHEGFGNEYLKSRTNIRSYLSDLLTAGINRIIVTGHSQGAALATVAATDLYAFTKDQVGGGNFEVRPITMGSPRVGDGDFADDFDEKLAGESGDTERSCRYVAEGENDLGITVEDLVTQLPLNDVPGIDYKHVSKKILVDFGTEECTITGKKGNIPCHSIFNYFEEIATQNSATDFSVTTPALDLSGLRSPLLTDLVISTRPVSQQSSIFSTVFSSSSNFLSSVFGSSPSSSNAGGSNSGASQLEMSMFLFAMVFGIIALIF